MSAIGTRRTLKRPRGPVPNHIQGWLDANGHDEWWAVVCEKCGRWVTGIDKLAPYHTEMNWCGRCDNDDAPVYMTVHEIGKEWCGKWKKVGTVGSMRRAKKGNK